MTDQPTPNTLRDAVQRHLTIARNEPNNRDAAFECAALAAGKMIDALDNGAPFPDAWQPFAAARNPVDVAHLVDSRSIAGDLAAAITAYRRADARPDEIEAAADDLAAAARALLDALAAPAQDEPDVAGLVADLGAARHTIQRLRDDRDQLRQRLDAATFTAQDHHDALEAIERLVRERDAATSRAHLATEDRDKALCGLVREATQRHQLETELHDTRSNLRATLATIEQAAAAPTTDHHAAMLTHAADTVHHTTTTGDRADLRRELKEHAHLHAANLKQGRDVPGETRRLTACILALGMTTFGADRKADDYADRLEGRLRDAAHLLQ